MKQDIAGGFIIAVCALINIYLSFRTSWAPQWQLPSTPHFSYVGDDFPELLPMVEAWGSVQMTMEDPPPDAPNGFPISGPGSTEKWESIYPTGYGFVRMGPEYRLLCVATFHQLHCIEKMRIFLDDPNNPIVNAAHQQHCMNYLRQSFLCAADMTLEPVDEVQGDVEDDDQIYRSGTGVVHTCKDPKALADEVSANYLAWRHIWNISEPIKPE